MNRIFLLICVFFWSCAVVAKPNLDSLYHSLDEAISQSSQYVELHEKRIAKMKSDYKASLGLSAQYRCCFQLYQAYRAFQNDSAIAYLGRCIVLAEEMGDKAKENNAKVLLAFQNSTTGDYVESYDILNKVDTTCMDVEGYHNYLWASEHLYGELSYYCKVPQLKGYYESKAEDFKKRILVSFPHHDDRYLQILETESRLAKKYKQALAYNDQRMALVKKGTHSYAIVAFYRALIYRQMDDRNTAVYYLLLSALYDARLAVMDQGSMWEVANMLNQDSEEFQRSYEYIKFAWKAARMFNTSVRSQQIMPVLSTIEENYQKELSQSNRMLRGMMALILLLLLIVVALLFYVNRQRMHLALTHKNLEVAYGNLNESNKMKELYIGRFLRLCAIYVDKIETMRKRVAKLVKAREFGQLNQMLQTDHAYVSELYDYFDSAFLKLFPNFVEEFNKLLKPEARIVLDDENKLTTTIRIFALIRLGIEDSGKIAEFLHYSVNTIYNYRAKVKNASLCNRDEFEEKIKQIGMK